MPNATVRQADLLRPEVIRNEIQDTSDQMERINLGDGYASAQDTFPLVNLDDPTEAWYTFGGSAGPMAPTAFDAESPVGTLESPDKRNVEIQSYKEKFNPDKGAETHYGNTPYSVFARAVQKIQQKIYLTREQISWRGDSEIDGLVGEYGTNAHPDLPDRNVITDGTDWSDSEAAEPIAEIEDINYETTANGYFGNGVPAAPTLYGSPSALRDLKQTSDMQDVLGYDSIQRVTMDSINEIFDEELGSIQRVMVQLPRTDADGNYIDADGNPVDNIDDAAHDNVLEPYDPETGENVRNIVIGRMGPSTAYFPWFLDRLTERLDGADTRGEFSIEENDAYFVQRWSTEDPVSSWIKGAMEVGFTIHRGENIGIIQGV